LRGLPSELEAALYEFADRHERSRLHRHARSGNVNGMANFVDVLRALTRVLLVWHRRGVVKRPKLIHRYCRYLEIATRGRTTDEEDGEEFDGFLWSTYQNLDRDTKLLQQACDETRFLATLRAVLLVVQDVRFLPKERSASRPRDVLRQWADLLASTISHCRLREPGVEDVQKALSSYRVHTPAEIDRLLLELPGR
jgi:hypothetical protein